MSPKNTPPALATPHAFKEKERLKIATSLNTLVADAFALYIKVKNFHWHVSGHHFRDYHLLFDEHAAQILAMLDPLAERVRKLGCISVHSISEIARLQKLKDNNASFLEAQSMLEELMNDNKNYASYLREAHHVCEKYLDVATCSLLEVFIDETERRVWFLFQTLVDNKKTKKA